LRKERENSWKIREEREKVAGWLHFDNKKVDIGVNSLYIYIYKKSVTEILWAFISLEKYIRVKEEFFFMWFNIVFLTDFRVF
jgi:hypothetical protein